MVDLLISRERLEKEAQETPAYYPTEDEKKIVASVKRKYRDKDISKRAYEKTWFISGAFIRGQHHLVFNDYTRAFEVPFRVPPHRVRLVINYILAYYRRTRARLTAQKPGFFVRPASSDQFDVERARLGQKVLDSELDRLNHFKKLKALVGWMLECGSCFWTVTWNPFAGTDLAEERPKVDETGQPVLDADGLPVTERVPVADEFGRGVKTGENELEIVAPYEIEVDPMATTMDNASWIMRNKIRSLAWIKETYPGKGGYVKAEQVYLHSFYEKRLRQLVGVFGYTTEAQQGESDQDAPKDSAVVHEYWERKSAKYPNGRYVVVAGEVLLHDGENPYRHGKFPYVKIDEINIPGRWWGMATIEHAIPLQRNLNRARSQEVENRTLMGRPKLLVPRTAKVRQSAFDAEPGERVDYNPGPRGERPELLWPQSTAVATQTEIQHTVNDMQELMSWHEVSRGILPSANIPGVGIEKLQQADDTSLGDIASNIDVGEIEMARLILSNCAQFWDEERMVRAGGESARVESIMVRGSDLSGERPDTDYFDVRVLPHSTLYKDPSAQRAMIQQMIEMQILNPVENREVIMKALDVADFDQVFADDRLDEQWAERENELMEDGTFSMPRDFENHEIHIKILNQFRKSERYRRLPPELAQLFDQHAEVHKQMGVMVMQERAAVAGGVQNLAAPPNNPESPDGLPGGPQGPEPSQEKGA